MWCVVMWCVVCGVSEGCNIVLSVIIIKKEIESLLLCLFFSYSNGCVQNVKFSALCVTQLSLHFFFFFCSCTNFVGVIYLSYIFLLAFRQKTKRNETKRTKRNESIRILFDHKHFREECHPTGIGYVFTFVFFVRLITLFQEKRSKSFVSPTFAHLHFQGAQTGVFVECAISHKDYF